MHLSPKVGILCPGIESQRKRPLHMYILAGAPDTAYRLITKKKHSQLKRFLVVPITNHLITNYIKTYPPRVHTELLPSPVGNM
jgi:hypothetical protein